MPPGAEIAIRRKDSAEWFIAIQPLCQSMVECWPVDSARCEDGSSYFSLRSDPVRKEVGAESIALKDIVDPYERMAVDIEVKSPCAQLADPWTHS